MNLGQLHTELNLTAAREAAEILQNLSAALRTALCHPALHYVPEDLRCDLLRAVADAIRDKRALPSGVESLAVERLNELIYDRTARTLMAVAVERNREIKPEGGTE